MPTAHAAHGSRGVNGAQLPQFPGGEAEQPISEQGIWACGGTPLPPQLWQPGGGAPGGGFGQDGVLDGMPPGPELGLLLPGAGDVSGLDDGELTGVVRGWRRMGSWAAAMEHAAVAELARRRAAEAEACGARSEEVARYAAAEVAAALTLTSCSADGLTGRALSLATLPGTWAALAAGRIDVPKALVILNGVSCLNADLARAVEAQVVAAAGGQTTGELRKAVAAAVVAAGPAAADARAAEAQKSARVERWAEPSGTAAMAGRDLPVAEVLRAGRGAESRRRAGRHRPAARAGVPRPAAGPPGRRPRGRDRARRRWLRGRHRGWHRHRPRRRHHTWHRRRPCSRHRTRHRRRHHTWHRRRPCSRHRTRHRRDRPRCRSRLRCTQWLRCRRRQPSQHG